MATHLKILGIVALSVHALLTLGCASSRQSADDQEWSTEFRDGKWWALSPWHGPRSFLDKLSAGMGYNIRRTGMGFSCETDGLRREELFVYLDDAPRSNSLSVRWGDDTPQTGLLGNIPSHLGYTLRYPDTQSALENFLANDKVTIDVLHVDEYVMYTGYGSTEISNDYDVAYQFDISRGHAAVEWARAKCKE